MCNVDLVFIEQHPSMAASKPLSNRRSFSESSRPCLCWRGYCSTGGCRVKISMIDDELFLHDADNSISTF